MLSALPPTYWTGMPNALEALTAEGLVSAAARVETDLTAGFRLAATSAAPPPIECPETASLLVLTAPHEP